MGLLRDIIAPKRPEGEEEDEANSAGRRLAEERHRREQNIQDEGLRWASFLANILTVMTAGLIAGLVSPGRFGLPLLAVLPIAIVVGYIAYVHEAQLIGGLMVGVAFVTGLYGWLTATVFGIWTLAISLPFFVGIGAIMRDRHGTLVFASSFWLLAFVNAYATCGLSLSPPTMCEVSEVLDPLLSPVESVAFVTTSWAALVLGARWRLRVVSAREEQGTTGDRPEPPQTPRTPSD